MDWIDGMQRALDYIEAHLAEDIDYSAVAREAASSPYHFQRVFSILCGYTLGEYIRMRRLTLAGAELADRGIRVIDAAVKYGYDSPDSFAKAFKKFHGVNPSEAPGAALRSFSPLRIKLTLEGASMLHYKIEEKPELILTGYKRRFEGSMRDIQERRDQEEELWVTTRVNQYVLQGLAPDRETSYEVVSNQGDDGYDFRIAWELTEFDRKYWDEILNDPDFAARYEHFTVPAGLYLVCETERCEYPSEVFPELCRRVATEWLPGSGYELDDRPELSVVHWYYRDGDEAYNSNRYKELWLPIVRKPEMK